MYIIISKKTLTLFPEVVAKKMDEAAGPFIKDGLIGVDHEEEPGYVKIWADEDFLYDILAAYASSVITMTGIYISCGAVVKSLYDNLVSIRKRYSKSPEVEKKDSAAEPKPEEVLL